MLSQVSALTHTPAVACLVSGSLAALLALLVSLRELIEMMSIGTLLAYTLVSVCVLLLRYQPHEEEGEESDRLHASSGVGRRSGATFPGNNEQTLMGDSEDEGSSYQAAAPEEDGEGCDLHAGPPPLLQRLLGGRYSELRLRLGMPGLSERPTAATGRVVTRCTLLLFLMSFLLWSTVIFGVEQGTGVAAVFSSLMAALMLGSVVKLLITILQQPESGRRLPYMAPCVPFVPAAAILVNSYLMLKLSPLTWARFAVWCLIGERRFHHRCQTWRRARRLMPDLLSTPSPGLLIYGGYGMWHSTLELDALEQRAHASSYQRYDDQLDDTFTADEGFYPHDPDDQTYQGWSAPGERGYGYQQQAREHQRDGGEGSQARPGGQGPSPGGGSRGRTNHGFDMGEED